MIFRRALVTLIAFAMLVTSAVAQDGKPGKNIKRELPQFKSHYLLWVHAGYKKETPGTVLIFLPNTMYAVDQYVPQFQDVVESKRLIYVVAKSPTGAWSNKDDKFILGILDDLKKDYPFDEKNVILVGNAEGAPVALWIGLSHPDRITAVAGVAGIYRDLNLFKGPLVKSVPIYIEHGEKSSDQAISSIRKWVQDLEKMGAKVKLAERAGAGDQIPLASSKSNPELLDWFMDAKAGNAKKYYEDAVAAKQANDYVRAIAGFQAIVAEGAKGEYHAQAKKELDAIQKLAKGYLSEAKELIKNEKYEDGMKALGKAAKDFEGLPEGETAAKELEELKKSPKLKEFAERQEKEKKEGEAEKAFEGAKAKEEAKDWGAAMRAYEDVANRFKDTSFGPKAAARAEELKKDPAIAKEMASGEAKKECEGLLKKAENYRKNGMIDKAAAAWKEIVEKHPDTEWAKEAQEMLTKYKK